MTMPLVEWKKKHLESTDNATQTIRKPSEITQDFIDEYGTALSVLDIKIMKLEGQVKELLDLLTKEGIGGRKLSTFGKSIRRRYPVER